jgi:hypothetical protein
MELALAGGSDRDNEQSQGSSAPRYDPRYPTPEFMRLLVELGRMAEREDRSERRLGDEPDGTARARVSPKD